MARGIFPSTNQIIQGVIGYTIGVILYERFIKPMFNRAA